MQPVINETATSTVNGGADAAATKPIESDYSSDTIVRSSRKRISSSLLVSEITKRTRPWLEVLA
jgi:hypothetical protein